MLAGNATDVSSTRTAASSSIPAPTPTAGQPPDRLRGIAGAGVYMSPNQGQVWTLMAGGIGNPLIVDTVTSGNRTSTRPATRPPTAPRAGSSWPCPPRPATPSRTPIYAGWLYAAVATPAGGFDGLFVTKDFGQNWTEVRIPTLPPDYGADRPRRSPPTTSRQPDYHDHSAVGAIPRQGNYDLILTVDPTNPNIIYLGGDATDGSQTGLIRVDATDRLGRPLAGRRTPTTPPTAAR